MEFEAEVLDAMVLKAYPPLENKNKLLTETMTGPIATNSHTLCS